MKVDCYLTIMSVLRLSSISERMINEYGAIAGMKIGRGEYLEKIHPSVTLSTTYST
jgi:hypothetical protein